jgi:hypothetical protein
MASSQPGINRPNTVEGKEGGMRQDQKIKPGSVTTKHWLFALVILGVLTIMPGSCVAASIGTPGDGVYPLFLGVGMLVVAGIGFLALNVFKPHGPNP